MCSVSSHRRKGVQPRASSVLMTGTCMSLAYAFNHLHECPKTPTTNERRVRSVIVAYRVGVEAAGGLGGADSLPRSERASCRDGSVLVSRTNEPTPLRSHRARRLSPRIGRVGDLGCLVQGRLRPRLRRWAAPSVRRASVTSYSGGVAVGGGMLRCSSCSLLGVDVKAACPCGGMGWRGVMSGGLLTFARVRARERLFVGNGGVAVFRGEGSGLVRGCWHGGRDAGGGGGRGGR